MNNSNYGSLSEEIFLKPIPGIIEKYVAGSDGHIYSYPSGKPITEKSIPIRLADCNNGRYFIVGICNHGDIKHHCVHKLICLAFHGEKPFQNACVRHLDGNWSNNKPNNLMWGSYSENEDDKRRHGRALIGEKHWKSKTNSQ